MIGKKLAHYEITGHLGTGGMGEVYQATDSKLGRRVAIKLLPSAFATDTDRIARFRREAQALAALNHPSIAQIYGLEEFGDTSCIVMELIEGWLPVIGFCFIRTELPKEKIRTRRCTTCPG